MTARRLVSMLVLLGALVAPIAAAFGQAPPAVANLPDQERRTPYSITNSTCVCSVGFALFGSGNDVDSWLQVWVGGVRKLSTDATYGWSLSSATGPLSTIPRPITDAVLTFNSAQTATIQIVGADRPRQLSQFTEGRGVAARDLNQRFTEDRAIARELWDKTSDLSGRGLFSQPGNVMGPLPLPSACAGSYLNFGSNGLTPTCISGMSAPVSGDLVCDLRAQGAKQDGVTDDSAAWSTCNSLLTSFGGGTIAVPPSPTPSCLKSGLTLGQGVVVLAAGNGYGNSNGITVQSSSPSRLSSCGVDVTLLNVANASSGFSGLDIQGLPFGTQPAVTVSATRFFIENNSINGGSIALKLNAGAVDGILIGNRIAQAYGTANLYVGAGASVHSIRNLTNQSWSGQAPAAHSITSIAAWQASTSYSAGNLATITFSGVSYYIQVTTGGAGTSGSTQPGQQPYGVNITDGTVTWQLRAPVGLYCEQYDGNGTSSEWDVDHSGACTGIGLTNSASELNLFSAFFGDNIGDGISAVSGSNLQIHGGAANSCKFTTCAEIRLTSGWTGPAIIDGMSIWAPAIGVSVEGGTNVRIIGSSFFGVTAEAINVANSITDVTATDNSLGTDTNLGTNAHSTILGTGTDYITFSNNNCHGATSGLTNSGSGAHNYIPSGGNPGC